MVVLMFCFGFGKFEFGGGDSDDEVIEMVFFEGVKGLVVLGVEGGVGGVRFFLLFRMWLLFSLCFDMVMDVRVVWVWEVGKWEDEEGVRGLEVELGCFCFCVVL